jgi:hypothetical protein
MKRKLLKGNYELEKNPESELSKTKPEHDLEKAALEHLGGSIAFVRDGRLYEENDR